MHYLWYDVYVGSDAKRDDESVNGENGLNISMEDNDVYEGGDVNAEYDVYLGSASTNQIHGITAAAEDDNTYDFYAGSQPVGIVNRALSDDDVIMTENDVYSKE